MIRRSFLLTSMFALVVAALAPGGARAGSRQVLGAAPPQRHYKPVCGPPSPHFARCNADVVTNEAGNPMGSTSPVTGSYGPSQFHTGYQLPCTPGGPVRSLCATPPTFGPQTIALIEAYLDPTAANDLAVYSSQYGLPACTTANGCLSVADENGGNVLPTTTDSTWALETSLDIEVAHAICQTCKILLLEANTSSYNDLTTAVNTAARLGATAISNSYGSVEWSNESTFDASYNHPGIAVVASSGDSGYGAQYPAVSPGVVAVGGTTLNLNADGTYNSESAWGSAGSGCSLYEPASSWQTQVSNWSQAGCGSNDAATDVSADADPSTGAAVYDSTPYNSGTGWYLAGGTSLAAPLIAAVYALAGGVPSGTNAQSIPYTDMNSSNSQDVTTGSNGTCSTIMCKSVPGYDGPTGLGTPRGTAGFGGSAPPPSSTSTPTAVPTATSVPPTSTPISGPTSTPTPCVLNKRTKCR